MNFVLSLSFLQLLLQTLLYVLELKCFEVMQIVYFAFGPCLLLLSQSAFVGFIGNIVFAFWVVFERYWGLRIGMVVEQKVTFFGCSLGYILLVNLHFTFAALPQASLIKRVNFNLML